MVGNDLICRYFEDQIVQELVQAVGKQDSNNLSAN